MIIRFTVINTEPRAILHGVINAVITVFIKDSDKIRKHVINPAIKNYVAKIRLPFKRENYCCCCLIASWYVKKALKAVVNTKLILIKRLVKDEIQHEIS